MSGQVCSIKGAPEGNAYAGLSRVDRGAAPSIRCRTDLQLLGIESSDVKYPPFALLPTLLSSASPSAVNLDFLAGGKHKPEKYELTWVLIPKRGAVQSCEVQTICRHEFRAEEAPSCLRGAAFENECVGHALHMHCLHAGGVGKPNGVFSSI